MNPIALFEAFSNIHGEFATIPFLFIKTLLLLDHKRIEKGIDREYLTERILSSLREQNNISVDGEKIKMFIKSIKEYQLNNRINPPLFGYSMDLSKVFIIDSTLYFFLKHCNRRKILEEITPI